MTIARMAAWARLAFRLQRWELTILAAGTLLFVVLGWVDVTRLHASLAAHRGCFYPDTGSCPALALADYNTWQELADTLVKAAWALPMLVGVVFGVPIVAREIEHGTGQIAWSLSTSRLRWLAGRVLPVVVAVVAALLLIGAVADWVTQAAYPRQDVSASFLWYGRRGILVAVRGLAWFGIALAVGAALGRSLLGLMAAGAVSVAVLIGTSSAISAWQQAVALPLAVGQQPDYDTGLVLDQMVRTPDGRLVSMNAVSAGNVVFSDERLPGDEMPAGAVWMQLVPIQIPGTDYPSWVAREGAIFAALAGMAGGLLVLIVQRRRPT